MNTRLILTIAVLALVPATHAAYSQDVPDWVKNNAGWWAEGAISEGEFVSAIEFLVGEGIIQVPETAVTGQNSEGIPDWVKTTALWWSQGLITDGEFVGGIQHLMANGIISVGSAEAPVPAASVPQGKSVPIQQGVTVGGDAQLDGLVADLEACSEIKKAYDRINCEEAAEEAITAYEYTTNGEAFEAGPVVFYYNGHDLEVTSSGQAVLSISMLAVNTDSENVTLTCTGPAICSYDIWNGEKAFKYSGTDFTNGQIVVKPGLSAEFTMVFGPNIGYGGTTFEYDSSKDYVFRVQEPWGGINIPLEMG